MDTVRLKRIGVSPASGFDARLDRGYSAVQGEEVELHRLTAIELRWGDPLGWQEVADAPAVPADEKKE